jgi:hypothetical protein
MTWCIFGNMFRTFIPLIIIVVTLQSTQAQNADIDSLRSAVLQMKMEVDDIKLNLATSENKFKRGIFVATLGYSTVIAGGLLLGRTRDDLGKALLVTGGATGVVGTVLMVDSFKYLGRPARRKR